MSLSDNERRKLIKYGLLLKGDNELPRKLEINPAVPNSTPVIKDASPAVIPPAAKVEANAGATMLAETKLLTIAVSVVIAGTQLPSSMPAQIGTT